MSHWWKPKSYQTILNKNPTPILAQWWQSRRFLAFFISTNVSILSLFGLRFLVNPCNKFVTCMDPPISIPKNKMERQLNVIQNKHDPDVPSNVFWLFMHALSLKQFALL